MRKMREVKRHKGVLSRPDERMRKQFLEWLERREESRGAHQKAMDDIMFVRRLCPL